MSSDHGNRHPKKIRPNKMLFVLSSWSSIRSWLLQCVYQIKLKTKICHGHFQDKMSFVNYHLENKFDYLIMIGFQKYQVCVLSLLFPDATTRFGLKLSRTFFSCLSWTDKQWHCPVTLMPLLSLHVLKYDFCFSSQLCSPCAFTNTIWCYATDAT